MDSEVNKMLSVIENEARMTERYTGRKCFNDRVLSAMASIPREQFVDSEQKTLAYGDFPLSIGYGQTISQPYIVALMTDMLDLRPDSTVLEVGTGSGYQAAILSKLASRIYSVERIPELYQLATKRLREQGFDNVQTKCGDGYQGWGEFAPYDGIIVTAAASHVPPALIDQLKPGGRMVIPVGSPHLHQDLMLLQKDEQGVTDSRSILGVAFVPLVQSVAQDKL